MPVMHLQGTFYIFNKRCRVTLTDEGVSWEPEGTPDLFRHVSASELVGCWLCPKGSRKCCLYAHPTATKRPLSVGVGVGGCKHSSGGKGVGAGLTLEYCERDHRGLKWKVRDVVLRHSAPEVILAWHHALWTLINGLSSRPKKLLVIVNPVGGKRKAHHIYAKKVDPLFRRAAIQTKVIQTDYQGHGRDLVENGDNLVGMDGVVVVGGDGLVNEVATGLLLRSSYDAGVDPDQPETSLPPTKLRIGIIPGGSTDATCHGTHGTSDVVTSALHIIMGDSRNVDIAAVHAKGRLQSVATTMVSYGYFGDLLQTSEQWRNLGPSRYLVSGILQFLRNRSYEGQLSVRAPARPLAQPEDSNHCCHYCSVCSKATKIKNSHEAPPPPGEWQQYTGKWSVVTSAVVSCACRMAPYGVSPSAHLGDGCTDLVLVSGGSRFRILSYLYRTSCTGNALGLNHVQVHRVKELHFTPKVPGPKSLWNCDGEQLNEPALRIKIHCQVLQMFCRGIETRSDESSKLQPKKSP